jgi:hypothetical protein
MKTRMYATLPLATTPVALINSFEKNYSLGRLEAIQEIMELLESGDVSCIDSALGELHLMHMKENNSLCENFGEGEPINCVEHYTDKYLQRNPSLETPTLLH